MDEAKVNLCQQKRTKRYEQININDVLNENLSTRQTFLKMFPSRASNPKTAIKHYIKYIEDLLNAYKNNIDSKVVFKHMVYATYEAKKNAIRLNEKLYVNSLCTDTQDAEVHTNVPTYSNYNDLSQMDSKEIKKIFIAQMEEQLLVANNAINKKDTPQIAASCIAINELTEIASCFLN